MSAFARVPLFTEQGLIWYPALTSTNCLFTIYLYMSTVKVLQTAEDWTTYLYRITGRVGSCSWVDCGVDCSGASGWCCWGVVRHVNCLQVYCLRTDVHRCTSSSTAANAQSSTLRLAHFLQGRPSCQCWRRRPASNAEVDVRLNTSIHRRRRGHGWEVLGQVDVSGLNLRGRVVTGRWLFVQGGARRQQQRCLLVALSSRRPASSGRWSDARADDTRLELVQRPGERDQSGEHGKHGAGDDGGACGGVCGSARCSDEEPHTRSTTTSASATDDDAALRIWRY